MSKPLKIAIVDYGVGNLFSIQNACKEVGLDVKTTNVVADIKRSDAVILPGVGAFSHAMQALYDDNLVQVLKDVVTAGKPLLGICLGMQLLMTDSTEFGSTPGLNLISGSVKHFNADKGRIVRVPQISWNTLSPRLEDVNTNPWKGSILEGLCKSEFMYFVHSYYVEPEDDGDTLARTTYGDKSYCSVVNKDNVVGCQFHPERSGPAGLTIYRNFARMLKNKNWD